MPEKIIKAFNQAKPGLIVTDIYEYNTKSYLVVAVHSLNETDISNPYYLISKISGRVIDFQMSAHLDEMNKIMSKRVYKRGK